MIEGVLRHNGLNILADLLVKTNLTKLLTKLDRFTLLAPNDDAFNLAANSTDINVIKHTLNYHIVESALPLSAVVNMTTKSITGDRLRFNIYRNNMTVNGALVLKTFEISKGVIYVIDKLLVPETAGQNIVELLEKKGGFTTFLTALNVSRLANHFETSNYISNCLIGLNEFNLICSQQMDRSHFLHQLMKLSNLSLLTCLSEWQQIRKS